MCSPKICADHIPTDPYSIDLLLVRLQACAHHTPTDPYLIVLLLVLLQACTHHIPTDLYLMAILLVLPQAFAGHIPTDPLVMVLCILLLLPLGLCWSHSYGPLFDGPTTCAPLKSVLVTFLLSLIYLMALLLVLPQAFAGHIPADPYLFDGPNTHASSSWC